jgi:hypothetical protein
MLLISWWVQVLSTSMFIYESQGEKLRKIFLPEVELQHEEDSRQ